MALWALIQNSVVNDIITATQSYIDEIITPLGYTSVEINENDGVKVGYHYDGYVFKSPVTVYLQGESSCCAGCSLDFTVNLMPLSADGYVDIKDGVNTIHTGWISNGIMSFSYELAVGTHSLKASYQGNSSYIALDSPILTCNIAKKQVFLELVENSSSNGSNVNFTVNIDDATATNTVILKEGVTELGSAALSNGSAVITVNLSAGSHTLKAVMNTSDMYYGAISNEIVHVVS